MKEKLHQVYLITNIVNGKVYVGQTSRRNGDGYIKRFKIHLWESKKLKTKRLAMAIRKYGEDKFVVELIEDNIPSSKINEREIYWIDYYKSFDNRIGYNMTLGGTGVKGYEFPIEVKEKLKKSTYNYMQQLKQNKEEFEKRNNKISYSLKSKHMKLTEEQKKKISDFAKTRTGEKNPFYGHHFSEKSKELLSIQNGVAINMYDLKTGVIVKSFNSSIRAAQYLFENNIINCKSSAVSRINTVCQHRGFSAYGYIWYYKKEFNEDKLTNDMLRKGQTTHNVPVYQCDLDGNVLNEFISYIDAAEKVFNNKNFRKEISNACKTGKPYKNYIWKYKNK